MHWTPPQKKKQRAVYEVLGVFVRCTFKQQVPHTDCLGTSRMPIALCKVALPSSTHSRLCVELLPGNHLDRTQLFWLCAAGTASAWDWHSCWAQVCVNDGLLTAVNSQCLQYCQVCVCVCAAIVHVGVYRACAPEFNSGLVREFHTTLLGCLGDCMASFPDWIPRD